MRTIAFIGPRGTGKSHRAMFVAKLHNADCIIDDGLLIAGSKIVAGTSGKREKTKIACVKHALFLDRDLAEEIIQGIKKLKPDCVMILGTSDAMVEKIAGNLLLPEISERIYIHDVATPEEIAKAQDMRLNQGKHVIPVPTFEIKEAFSGYFLHPLRFIKKFSKNAETIETTIVRPTFSYLGDYTISDNVLISISKHEALKNPNVVKINSVGISKNSSGVVINISVSLKYGSDIIRTAKQIMKNTGDYIEHYASVNVISVNVNIRELIKKI